MRIEWQINPQDSRFLEVSVDGEIFCEVHKSSFGKTLIDLKGAKTIEELKRCFEKVEETAALKSALSLLARRGYFAAEMRKKLKERRFSKNALERAVVRCEELGYIDEASLLESAIAALKARGKGRAFIARFLAKRMGAPVEVGGSLEEERAQIQKLLLKRFAKEERTMHSKARALRFLLSRGFSYDLCLEELQDFV